MRDHLPTPDSTRRALLRAMGAAGGLAVAGASLTGTVAASNPRHCPRTPGFYKNHYPAAWPKYVTGENKGDLGVLSVGGATYRDPEDLITILETPPRGDKAIIMAHHLIAAKLNMWAAPTGSLCPAIEAFFPEGETSLPDAWLEANPLGCDVRHWGTVEWRGETYDGEAIKDRLEAYNEGRLCSCSDSYSPTKQPKREDSQQNQATVRENDEHGKHGRRGPPGR